MYAEFEVLLGFSAADEPQAVANASKYLAYGDQSNVFGDAVIIGTEIVDYLSDWEYGVALSFGYDFTGDDEVEQFMRQMRQLSHVVSVERLA